MKLGSASYIALGSSDLALSEAFWHFMGFRKIGEGAAPQPWIQLTDGSLLLLITRDKKEYLNLTYMDARMQDIVDRLDNTGIPLDDRVDERGRLVQGTIKSGNGANLTMVNFDPQGIFQPSGKTLRHLTETEMQAPGAMPNPRIGVFGELSLPVTSLDKSLSWWTELGYQKLSDFTQPYPWAILADDYHIIGLHQSSHITKPAFTYFAPDMKDRIQRLQTARLPVEGFMGADPSAGNAVLQSPEGQQVFLFSFGG